MLKPEEIVELMDDVLVALEQDENTFFVCIDLVHQLKNELEFALQ